jgi:uncharacterized membrane protein
MLLNPRSDPAGTGPAQDGAAFHSMIKRNCSMSPRAVLVLLAVTAAVCFGIGAVFAWQGLWMVLPFAGLEVAGLAAAFYVSGRHAGDCERYWLEGGELVVEVRDGPRLSHYRFQAAWARIVLVEGWRDTRLAVAASGRELIIGRHLPAAGRALLARELTRALRAAGGANA